MFCFLSFILMEGIVEYVIIVVCVLLFWMLKLLVIFFMKFFCWVYWFLLMLEDEFRVNMRFIVCGYIVGKIIMFSIGS